MNKEEEKILISLLERLKQAQTAIDIIVSTKFEKETTHNVNNKIKMKEENIQKDAKRYGQKNEVITPILEEYSNSLKKVKDEYSDEKNLWLIEKGNIEKYEMELTIQVYELKNQLIKMINSIEETSSLKVLKKQIEICKIELSNKKEQIEESREASRETIQSIEECKNECNNSINNLTEEKYLVESDSKNNILKKIFDKITDKIAGKAKFNQNVAEPLKMQIANIKEKAIGHDIPEKLESLMELAKEGAKQIIFKNSALKGIAIMASVETVSLVKDGIEITNEISAEKHLALE